MSIGYEISVTALQMVTAYATIANDGIRVQPHIIKEIRSADGKVFSKTEAQKTQVVTADTARSLKKMLRSVVLTGTGKKAQLNGYTSAGKTGTAWKYDAKLKKINENKYVSSFVGMAPIDNPSVVIAVVLDEPSIGGRDGGQVSAPIFRDIAEQILPELSVVPDGNIRQENLTAEEIPTEIEPRAAVKNEKVKSEKDSEKRAKPDTSDKKSADPEKTKDVKKTRPPDKKGATKKTAGLTIKIPGNRSSDKEEKT